MKCLIATALAAAVIAAGLGFAETTSNKVVIPVTKTDATSGKQMFTSYCAPCHGTDGKGHGPTAAALKTAPSDLTGMTMANHGKFPETHIYSVLQFGSPVSAHGSAEMPVWGPIFGKMNQSNPQDKQLRISNLSRYLETIQAK